MWNLNDLKKTLESKESINHWRIIESKTQRSERYFINDESHTAIDQDRSSDKKKISIEVFTKKDSADRHGQAKIPIFPELDLKGQIDKAISIADQVDVQKWSLPEDFNAPKSTLKTADEAITQNATAVLDQLSSEIEKASNQYQTQLFNSAELFLADESTSLHLSNGLEYEQNHTEIYAEAAYSGKFEDRSDEYLKTKWAVHQNQLNIDELFKETHERASEIVRVKLPESGKYSVLVDEEVMMGIFNTCLSQLSRSHEYQKLPFKNIGEAFIENPKGDLIDLSIDPSLDYGADTTSFSFDGIAQKNLTLIDQNHVKSLIATKQYADYLETDPTSSRGTVTLKPGHHDKEALLRMEDEVLEVCQFSALFFHPITCTFSSEIRLAKLHNNKTGKVTFIKGGSLSASLFEGFQHAHLSSEIAHEMSFGSFSSGSGFGQGYKGPKYALLRNVSVVS